MLHLATIFKITMQIWLLSATFPLFFGCYQFSRKAVYLTNLILRFHGYTQRREISIHIKFTVTKNVFICKMGNKKKESVFLLLTHFDKLPCNYSKTLGTTKMSFIFNRFLHWTWVRLKLFSLTDYQPCLKT